MTDPHQFDRRPATTAELVIDFLKVRFWSIIMVACGIGAIFAFAGYDLTVPRWVKLFGVTFIVLSPAGYVVGQKVVSLLWSPNYVYLLDLDARYTDGALYRFPFEHFHDLEVTEGALDELTSNLYIGKDVDLEEKTVRGTWRGTLTDRELLTALSKVDECYGQLRDDAKEGFTFRNKKFSIVYNAVRDGVLHVVETFERGALPDEGESIGDAVDDALDRYDLESRVEDLAEDLDPDPEDAERDPEREYQAEQVGDLDPIEQPEPEASADD
jgi:hypothetical protein